MLGRRLGSITTMVVMGSFTLRGAQSFIRPALLRSQTPVLSTTTHHKLKRHRDLMTAATAGGAAASADKKVLVPIGDGSEEIEAVTIIDTLVRGGAKVTVASVMPSLQVTCSRGVKIVADKPIGDCTSEDWDLIVCPGGMPGAEHLRDSQPLVDLLRRQQADKRLYGAICASPAVVLQTHGLLEGSKATCYPADKFTGTLQQYTSDSSVVEDGNVITSQGPGTTFAFALRLVSLLFGEDKAKEVAAALLVSYP